MNPTETALFYARLGYSDQQVRVGVAEAHPDLDDAAIDTECASARDLFEQEEREAAATDAQNEVRVAHGEFDDA